MLALQTKISTRKGLALEKEVANFIQARKRIKCKALNGRPIFLEKYLSATAGRIDKNRRRQAFWCGIELIQRKSETDEFSRRENEFEFIGTAPNGCFVGVHIREEFDPIRCDRKLFLISTFFKDPK